MLALDEKRVAEGAIGAWHGACRAGTKDFNDDGVLVTLFAGSRLRPYRHVCGESYCAL